MNKNKTRVRFAPAPTGLMHIGNVRTALLNYLFALQNNGTFILRIEDTDPERNFDPEAKEILKDLEWLNIGYDEGPVKGGPYKPYFQSARTKLYKEYLDKLFKDKKTAGEQNRTIYRCFCSTEDLDKKRNRQIALKQAPRYDKTCLKLTDQQIEEKLNSKSPFIWRFNVEPNQEINLVDISKGTIKFNTSHLTDFPLTRQDGTFTFLFANAIDDILMKITDVFRGEDHLTNSANQLLIYKTLNAPEPRFLHLPIVCNAEGKKLSKRDKGFSLRDLQNEGFLPEAINNYLAILGHSFSEEILSMQELAKVLNFATPSASQIKYDLEKLKWINHKWIARLEIDDLVNRCIPILKTKYPEIANLDSNKINELIKLVQPELITLNDISEKTAFFFVKPQIGHKELEKIKNYKENEKGIKNLISKNMDLLDNPDEFINKIKSESKKENFSLAIIFPVLRLALIGTDHGPNIVDIINILGIKESRERLLKILV